MKVVSVDPALGGGFGILTAMFTAEKLVILDAFPRYNLNKTEEQLELIEQMAARYRPSRVIIEGDAQQKGLLNDDRLAQMSGRYGFTIVPHYTRQKKLDIIFGVAAMDQAFKRGAIRIPWGDEPTRERMAALVKQLREWRPAEKVNGRFKYTSQSLRQDLVMALWFAYRNWDDWVSSLARSEAPRQRRPSWIVREPLPWSA